MITTKLSGRYRLERQIGLGGMATVWLAIDEVLTRPVAAKLLHPSLAKNDELRERFRAEAMAAASLTHPNIISIYDTAEHEGVPFVVMEYLHHTLRNQLMTDKILAPELVISLGLSVCDALILAHSSGVIHCDLRPENILFSSSGQIKVTDFGVAKAAFGALDLNSTEELLGTTRYLSPEQLEGREPEPRSDLYSLGVILYEATTGAMPVGPPPSPRDLRPDVPRSLDRLIMRSLEPLERRYQDAITMRRDFQSQVPSKAEVSRAEVPKTRVAETSFLRTEGRLLLYAFVILAFAAALVLSVAQLSKQGQPLEALGDLLGRERAEPRGGPEILGAGTFDPVEEGGDGIENDDDVRRAIDGNEETFWATTGYANAEFGGLKSGVGLYIDLGGKRSLSSIEVVSVTPGWKASIRSSDDTATWSPPRESELVMTSRYRFEVSGEHRYWMIWITSLVQTSGRSTPNFPYTVAIAEIRAM